MTLLTIWSTLEESFDILGEYGYPAMDRVAEEMRLPADYFTWIAAIWLFGSETFTTTEFMRMFPYGQAGVNEACFASATRKGYLISGGQGRYTRSAAGLNIAQKLWRAAGDSLLPLSPIPAERMQQLLGYLQQLVVACLAAPEPPSHYYLVHKHENYSQYGTQGPLEDFIVRFGALTAYRDDAHIAAWQVYGVEGHTWETFDAVVRNSALTFDDLLAKIKRRVPTEEILSRNLAELTARGWAQAASGKIQVTAKGRQVRAKVEAETERLFFAPWSCLNESELDELASLASQLRDGFKSSSH